MAISLEEEKTGLTKRHQGHMYTKESSYEDMARRQPSACQREASEETHPAAP